MVRIRLKPDSIEAQFAFFGKIPDYKKLFSYKNIPTHKYTGQGAKLLADS